MSGELERLASEKLKEAIRLDNQGVTSRAVSKYRDAVEILLKLWQLCDNPRIRAVYLEKVERYQARIRELEAEGPRAERTRTRAMTLEESVVAEKPGVSWDDIVDLEDAKSAVKESIVYPDKRPDLFPLGWPRGLLFFGPPGCGKTLLGAAVAAQIDAVFYYVDAATIMSKWLGESEKNVSRLFASAREESSREKAAIIFIDEIDSLTSARQVEVGGETRARSQLLKEMDGLREKGRSERLYVIGATNKPWVLDEPFIRRFQKRIYVPLPDEIARRAMFKQYTKDLVMDDSVDLDELAKMTHNYSGSDIHDLCMMVQIKVVRELFDAGLSEVGAKPRSLNMNDFLEAKMMRGSSISTENLVKLEQWFRVHGAL